MQFAEHSVLDVTCLQQPVDKISRSHSADNAALNLNENIEGIFYAAKVNLIEKMNTVYLVLWEH